RDHGPFLHAVARQPDQPEVREGLPREVRRQDARRLRVPGLRHRRGDRARGESGQWQHAGQGQAGRRDREGRVRQPARPLPLRSQDAQRDPAVHLHPRGEGRRGRPQQCPHRQGGRRERPRHRLHAARLSEASAAAGSSGRRPSPPAALLSAADLFGQARNGLSYGVLLFLLSVGLTLIFGMLDIVNLAHGSFYMLGAYAGLALIAGTGSFWVALAAAPLIVGLVGAAVERTCLRPLYRRPPLDQVLLTFGFIYVFEDVVKSIWGGRIRSIPSPDLFSGSVSVFGATIPSYRLFVIAFGLAMAGGLWLLIERTRLGAIVRAGVFDAEMTAGMGIDIDRVFTGVFAGGAALAGLSGGIGGPIQSAYPPMGASLLVPALIVVVVGGLGSLKGSLAGSLIIGQAETFGKVWLPGASMLIIYVVMALILLLRPQGLFGRPLR